MLGKGEGLGVGAVGQLQVVQDGEDRDGGELLSHRLQSLLSRLPELHIQAMWCAGRETVLMLVLIVFSV